MFNDLGETLREYRREKSLTQRDLAELLGFDQSYISRLEAGTKRIRNVDEIIRIGAELGLTLDPVTELGNHIIDLAAGLREAGQPAQALDHIQALLRFLTRSEVQPTELALKTHCRALTAQSLILGDLRPETELGVTSIRAAESAWSLARETQDQELQSEVLRCLGNELRKARRPNEGIPALVESMRLAAHPAGRGSAAQYAARAFADATDWRSFQDAMKIAYWCVDRLEEPATKFNDGTVAEVAARALFHFGRVKQARPLIEKALSFPFTVPQWRVIVYVTAGELSVTEHDLESAIFFWNLAHQEMARSTSLPHQLERVASITRAVLADKPDLRRHISGTWIEALEGGAPR